MQRCRLIREIRKVRWSRPEKKWGLIPTMGYLHEGHLSLVRRAREENEYVAVSIFVNPTQFAPTEDLASYPRDLAGDLEQLESAGVDVVFNPDEAEIYPPGFQTLVNVSELTKPLEGASRPTHFEGVTTIVAKLFNIVQPHRAYFGQKDAQQAIIVQRMVADLHFNLQIVVCPIVREPDGLAMSSRNARLTPPQRAAAPILYRALAEARDAVAMGERDASALRARMVAKISAEPLAHLDYVSIADPRTLEELDVIGSHVLFSGAVFFGDVRLIDNILI